MNDNVTKNNEGIEFITKPTWRMNREHWKKKKKRNDFSFEYLAKLLANSSKTFVFFHRWNISIAKTKHFPQFADRLPSYDAAFVNLNTLLPCNPPCIARKCARQKRGVCTAIRRIECPPL